MKLIPRDGGGYMVMTNVANRDADCVVVAAGAWSGQLLSPLGIRVPLETERGYHAMLFSPSVQPRIPISSKTRAFFMTPMEDGLRVAGTVEIAGLEARSGSNGAQRSWLTTRAVCFPHWRRATCATGWGFVHRLPTACRSWGRWRVAPVFILHSVTVISA